MVQAFLFGSSEPLALVTGCRADEILQDLACRFVGILAGHGSKRTEVRPGAIRTQAVASIRILH